MNKTFILSLIKKYDNGAKEISQDDFLELVEGLEQDETEEVLSILAENGYRVIDELSNRIVLYRGGELRGLTNEELCVLAQRGNEAAQEVLISNNEKLVHKIAIRIMKQYKPVCMDEEDLFVEGCMGLMTAIDKFDVTLGYKLSTYACNWIFQAITRAVMNDGFDVRLPIHVFEKVIRVNKCRKLHGALSISELQKYVNEDFNSSYSYEEIKNYVMYADKYLNTASLNKVINNADGGDTELMDFVASDQSVEDQVMDIMISEEISKLLATLSEREHAVINMRFGLEGNNRKTLEEIGLMYNVTRERIRQIESRAIKKLMHPSRRSRLEGIYA